MKAKTSDLETIIGLNNNNKTIPKKLIIVNYLNYYQNPIRKNIVFVVKKSCT